MSFATLRWILAGLATLAVGVGLGVFATRTLYGDPDGEAVRPARERPVRCPPCEPCPTCPPPPRCEDGHLVPADAPLPDGAGLDEDAVRGADPGPGRPGVSMKAIAAAEAAVLDRVPTCAEVGAGTAVLELTVTVTGTTGAVRDVFVSRARLEPPETERCLEAAARDATFPAVGPEGESVLKLPVRLSDPDL